MWLECAGGGQDGIWRAPMILRFSTPPRHRLFFQPCAEPNPENGRIWSPRRFRANTTRLDLGIACALNPTPAIRRKSPAQIEPDSREALHPAPPAPAAASQAVALGHPPVYLSVRKRGDFRRRALPCRRCQSIGQMITVWPEHSGDSMTFSSLREGTNPFACPTRRLRALSQGIPLCSARILWANQRAIVIRAVGSAPSSIARLPPSSRQVGRRACLLDR